MQEFHGDTFPLAFSHTLWKALSLTSSLHCSNTTAPSPASYPCFRQKKETGKDKAGGFCIRNAKAFSEVPSILCLHLIGQYCGTRQLLTERMSRKGSVLARHIITISKIRVMNVQKMDLALVLKRFGRKENYDLEKWMDTVESNPGVMWWALELES